MCFVSSATNHTTNTRHHASAQGTDTCAPPAPRISGTTGIRRHYTRHPSCNKANAYGPKVQKWHKAKISKFAAAKTPFYRHASGRVFAAMLRQQSTQKERRVVWQGQYAILKPNIPAMKLHAP